jgi:hypothetical protein
MENARFEWCAYRAGEHRRGARPEGLHRAWSHQIIPATPASFARKEFFAPRPKKHPVVAAPQIAIAFDLGLTRLSAPISMHRD